MNNDVYHIIGSGSSGNSMLILKTILVDIGLPFYKIKPFIKNVNLITWSHSHSDHYNMSTLKKIIFERPGIRLAICEHEYKRALESGTKNIDVLEYNKWYDYGKFQISTFKTYHDVPSNGWRIKNKDYKIFIATDTAHLQGITAYDYTHYLCESNYDEETIIDKINTKVKNRQFAYEYGAINSHLSEQQARQFFFENKGLNSIFVRLHESKSK